MVTKRTTATKAKAAPRKTVSSTSSTQHVQDLPSAPMDVTTRDTDGRTPLHMAAFYGYPVMVRKMLLQQADVAARDNLERTPGHWSAFKGHLEVIKVLVEFGADINARDSQGRTLLKMAIIGHQPAIEALLRSHGAEV